MRKRPGREDHPAVISGRALLLREKLAHERRAEAVAHGGVPRRALGAEARPHRRRPGLDVRLGEGEVLGQPGRVVESRRGRVVAGGAVFGDWVLILFSILVRKNNQNIKVGKMLRSRCTFILGSKAMAAVFMRYLSWCGLQQEEGGS